MKRVAVMILIALALVAAVLVPPEMERRAQQRQLEEANRELGDAVLDSIRAKFEGLIDYLEQFTDE